MLHSIETGRNIQNMFRLLVVLVLSVFCWVPCEGSPMIISIDTVHGDASKGDCYDVDIVLTSYWGPRPAPDPCTWYRITFFYRMTPGLIEAGRLYMAMPPLPGLPELPGPVRMWKECVKLRSLLKREHPI